MSKIFVGQMQTTDNVVVSVTMDEEVISLSFEDKGGKETQSFNLNLSAMEAFNLATGILDTYKTQVNYNLK